MGRFGLFMDGVGPVREYESVFMAVRPILDEVA